MTKLDWTRTRPGSEGYDADLAREWRSGPSGASFERPDGSHTLNLLAPPTMFWAKEMGRAYPVEDAASHLALYSAARRAAATLYFGGGWPVVRARVPLVYKKASAIKPFPSTFYAVYFDYWAMTFARGDSLNKTGAVPKHIDKYSNRKERWFRAPMAPLHVPGPNGTPIELKRTINLQEWLDSLYERMKEAERP
jgi:hypothetical protein